MYLGCLEVADKGEVRFIGEVESGGETSTVLIYPEYCPGLLGVQGYSHLIVLYWMHLRDDDRHRRTLQVRPPRHEGAPLTGVFACRSPSRPNPLGLTIVELEGVDGCRLRVRGLDALEGSPIVDLKPYQPRADSVIGARTPEWSLHGPPT
jgi:tRNA-Thr(GGU) m(6)t(6)A37 methyltransferase TsaA